MHIQGKFCATEDGDNDEGHDVLAADATACFFISFIVDRVSCCYL